MRELDKERANLEKQEQKLIADIRKYAKENQRIRGATSQTHTQLAKVAGGGGATLERIPKRADARRRVVFGGEEGLCPLAGWAR